MPRRGEPPCPAPPASRVACSSRPPWRSCRAASLALSGCAAGQYSQTADQVAAIDGANGTVGDIAVLNARLAPTEREDYPPARMPGCCSGSPTTACKPDTLSRITTSAAESVEIVGDPTVPGQTLADFATEDGTEVTVTGFLQDQYYGVSIPMTFSFANAGTLSLNIPIEVPAERSTDRRDDRDPAAAPDPDLGRGSARRAKRPAAERDRRRDRHHGEGH